MPYQEFDGELDDDNKKPAGFVEFSGELDQPAPARKSASRPKQPMGRGFGMPRPAPAPEPLAAPAGWKPSKADLEWQSLTDAGQEKALEARGISTKPRSTATIKSSPERTGVQRVLDATVRKPLDTSLAGAALETLGDAGRGIAQGGNQIAASGYGLLSAGLDVVGAGDTPVGEWAAASGKAGGERAARLANPADPESITSKVFSSVTQNATTFGLLGFGNKALAGMFAASAGQDYAATDGSDLSESERLTRAAYMGAAEVIGERVSLPALGKLFKASAATTSVKDLGRMLEQIIVREQIGEQATTALQSAFEKFSPTGTRPDMTLGDYIDDVVETAKVTLGQSLVMGGAGAARTIGSAARRSENSDQFGAALEADVADTELTPVQAPMQPTARAVFTSPTTERAGITPIVVDVPQGPLAVPNAQQPDQTAVQGAQTQPEAPTPQPTDAKALKAHIDAAANLAATSPLNDLPEPTPEQKESGDYVKGPVQLHGMQINVENPAGSTRSGVDPDGKAWSTQMRHHYGEIEGSKGADGDKVDAFIGPNPESKTIFVVDQVDPKTGAFDEHKAMVGFTSEEEARQAYLSNYQTGWQGLGQITAMPAEAFRSWVKDGAKKGPIGDLQQPAASPAVAGAQSAIDRLAAAQDAGIAAAKGTTDGNRDQRAVEQPAASAQPGEGARVPAVAASEAPGREDPAPQAASPSAPVTPLTAVETNTVIGKLQDLRLKRGEAVRLTPIDPSSSDDADLASRVSSALGRPVLFFKPSRRTRMNAAHVPLGGGRSVVAINIDSQDSMLALAVHEGLHGMDADVKAKLHSALFDGDTAPVTAEHRARFREEYPGYSDDKVDEEIAAFLAQQDAKRPAFWKRLAEKVGDGAFGKLAKAILDKLDGIAAAFEGSNSGVFTNNVKAVREALTEAYAETIKRRGQSQTAEADDVEFSEQGRKEQVGDYQARVFKDGRLTVTGDAEAIRAKLPDDVQGRVTKDGIAFTSTDAARVRRALEGNNLAYSRAGEVVEKLPMRGGKYVGAPTKFDTPAKIPHLRKWLKALTLEGERGRFWYENSSREVLRMTGGDVQEARKFVALLAIYSPQAKVDANSTFALRAWAQYKAGQPISVKTKVMDDKAKAALDDVDAFWSGEKTGNFFHNLLREIDPSTEGKQGATIDMWMMRAGQYDNDAPTATQYAFMENETNRVAAEMGWEPQQVQAAIWVAMKARMENDGVKKATEASSEKKGWIRFDKKRGEDGKLSKVRVILDADKHRANWLKHAFEHTPTADDTAKAKFDFADGLLRHIGQVSFEARPGRTTGVLPGIHDAPYAQQVEFQQAVQRAFLDDQGRDTLAHYLGLLVDNDILLPGVWQGEVSPSTQKRVAMAPAKGDAGKSKVDPAQAEALNLYAAVAGLVARQEGVGWHRPFYAGAKSKANGVDIDIGRPLNPREVADLEKAVGKWMIEHGKDGWQNQFAFISSPTGIRLVNFGVVENNELHDNLISVAEQVLPDFDWRAFASDGDMPTNDWKEQPNGQGYVQRIGAAGRPDVLDWARSVLAPRVQRVFDDFSERYGWGDAGSIDFSEQGGARGAAGRQADDGGAPASERAVREGQQEALSRLPGYPTTPAHQGPDARLVAVAEQYARDAGIKLTRQSRYAEVDVDRAQRIAKAYDAMPHAPQDPAVREAYENLVRQTVAQYRALERAGYKFWLYDGDTDPYGTNPWEAMRDLRANQSMGVFATRAGFGSDVAFDPSENPLLAETGIEWPFGSPTGAPQPVLANDLFRAVHDAFGHGLEGTGFRAQGEENAWQAHARLFTGSALGAITSETRGQNSWLNYGPHGETNRNAGLFDTVFADQKTGLMPSWTWEEGRIDFSEQAEQSPLGFYSALARAAVKHPANALPASAWRDAIKGWVNKGLVKVDEVEWSGINDWLAMQDGKVTRDALTAYLDGNGVKVEETVLGEQKRAWYWVERTPENTRSFHGPFETRAQAEAMTEGKYEWDILKDDWVPVDPDKAVTQRLLQGDRTKYDQYTLPGGENYREVLLTLPDRTDAVDEHRAFLSRMKSQYPGTIAERNAAMTPAERLTLERLGARANAQRDATPYKSGHWDQKNIVAHIRVNDRTDADGNRVLFVEEIQSDWGQDGKKRGFNDPAAKEELRAAEAEVEAARSELEELAVEGRQATAKRRELREKYDRMLDESERHPVESRRSEAREAMVELERLRDIEVERARAFSDRNHAAKQRYDAAVEATRFAKARAAGGVPQAPFVGKTDAWLNLALKRVITMAMQGGYDKVAFVTGEQSADRYDLSKQVQELMIEKDGDNFVIAYKPVGGTYSDGNRWSGKKVELPDVVGKELADKVAAQPEGRSYMRGVDLKVGGEGMKAFYDKIVPNAVKTLAKKLGGEVGTVQIGAAREVSTSIDDGAGGVIKRHQDTGEMLEQPGLTITPAMRDAVGDGLPMFSDQAYKPLGKETDSWLLSRDATGRFRFGAGAKAYRAVADLANRILERLAMAPASRELTRYMRQMKQEIAKAQELTVDVAEQMSKMSEGERLMISDVIERELNARIKPPAEVLKMAASISAIMGKQTDELVRLGMLSEEAAEAWRDRYLPRFYESKLTGGKVKDAWESALAALTRKPRAIAGINGSSLKRRGMVKTILAVELAQWEAEGWKLDDKTYDPNVDVYTQVHRDFTREEREKMGEIRDANFRFVMGYMRSQKDIALGRMYEKLAAEMAHKVPPNDGRQWVKVPDTKVEDTKAFVYGALAGKYVPKEILDHLSQFQTFEDPMLNEMFRIYKKGLSMWKEGKTVLNPVSHVNNIVSNLTMAHFAGVSYWDAHKYVGAARDMVKGAPMLKEAKDAGLFGGTFNEAELLTSMPEQLRILAAKAESKVERGVDAVWNALAWWLRKPLGRAYEGEDQFFRYVLYRDARQRGLSPDDAIDWATSFIFTYDDLPKGARVIRDFGIPFFSYTYKAFPALAQTALEHPMRFAAPAALVYGANLMGYALAAGGDDDEWADVVKRLFTDADFRAKVQETEQLERANLPKWNRGRTAMATQKTIRLGEDDVTGLPVFLDVSRFIPGGDMLDMENNAGGIDWLPAPLTPSNPVLTTIIAMVYNKDAFLGKEVVDANDTSGEAALKRGDWLWKQFSPAIAVNGYHWTRAMNAIAYQTGEPITWWPLDATGFGKDGLPTQASYAAMQTFGVKARPIDLDMSEVMDRSQREKVIRDIEAEVRRIQRLRGKDAISDRQADEQIDLQRTKMERLREGLDVNGKTKD